MLTLYLPVQLFNLSLDTYLFAISSSISLAEVLDLPSGPSPQMPAVESRLSANMSNLADAFQTVATPLLSSLPKRIVVDQENGDLYASKSVEVLKKRGWSSFGQEQQKMLADRVTMYVAISVAIRSFSTCGGVLTEWYA